MLLAVNAASVLCLLTVGLVRAYTISTQNLATVTALRLSQGRADEASKTQTAILSMGKAQAQLVGADYSQERRRAAVSATRAMSVLDEGVQRFQEALPRNPTLIP
jgi:hypothetical protein